VDLPMLRAAHRPIVLPGPGGRLEARLAAELPQAERAARGGPEGWNDAVLAVLTGRRLAAVTADDARGAREAQVGERELSIAARG
jgi:hypothetical protein